MLAGRITLYIEAFIPHVSCKHWMQSVLVAIQRRPLTGTLSKSVHGSRPCALFLIHIHTLQHHAEGKRSPYPYYHYQKEAFGAATHFHSIQKRPRDLGLGLDLLLRDIAVQEEEKRKSGYADCISSILTSPHNQPWQPVYRARSFIVPTGQHRVTCTHVADYTLIAVSVLQIPRESMCSEWYIKRHLARLKLPVVRWKDPGLDQMCLCSSHLASKVVVCPFPDCRENANGG